MLSIPRLFLIACLALAPGLRAAENQLTAAERADGWQLLFDGTSLTGWRGYRDAAVKGWEVSDGTLHAIAKTSGAMLVTTKTFSDFEFSWEWKLPLAGNNGVKYFVSETRSSAPGHEYQMLDDANHPDGKSGRTARPRRSTTSSRPPPTRPPNRSANGTSREFLSAEITWSTG